MPSAETRFRKSSTRNSKSPLSRQSPRAMKLRIHPQRATVPILFPVNRRTPRFQENPGVPQASAGPTDASPTSFLPCLSQRSTGAPCGGCWPPTLSRDHAPASWKEAIGVLRLGAYANLVVLSGDIFNVSVSGDRRPSSRSDGRGRPDPAPSRPKWTGWGLIRDRD